MNESGFEVVLNEESAKNYYSEKKKEQMDEEVKKILSDSYKRVYNKLWYRKRTLKRLANVCPTCE